MLNDKKTYNKKTYIFYGFGSKDFMNWMFQLGAKDSGRRITI